MSDADKQFESREMPHRPVSVRRGRHRSIGNTALHPEELTATDRELLIGLPQPKRPTFLDEFARALDKRGYPLADIRREDRLQFAHLTHEYLMDLVYEQNERRRENNQQPLKLSPRHLEIPHRLNRYYAAYSSSLTPDESLRMREQREAKLQRDTETARSYLPLGYVDLQMTHGLERMMNDFYPGPAAEAATEILAAYGAGMAKLQLGRVMF